MRNDVLHVLITRHTIYGKSSDCTDEEYIYRLHGIFDEDGLKQYAKEIKEVRSNHSSNWLFIIPLNRFLKEGMRL